jgi:cytochrome c5
MTTYRNAIAVLCVLVGFSMATRAVGQDTNTVNSIKASAAANKPQPPKAAVKRELSGAELYSIHCNRCHPERYPTERTAAQWKTILMHMRVRANLPAEQSRTILKYLQENSGR